MRSTSAGGILTRGGLTTARGSLPMSTSASFMRLCKPGLTVTLSAHTTPVVERAPSGTLTISPGFSSIPSGTRYE